MSAWRSNTTVAAAPAEVLAFLTEPEAIALWAPVPFEVLALGVRYVLRPVGERSEVDASVSVEGRGLFGRVLAKATETLLAAGALRLSLDRLARELQPALAA